MPRRLRSILLVVTLCASPCVSEMAPTTAGTLAAQSPDSSDVPPRPAGLPSKSWERALVRAVRPTPGGVQWQMNVSESTIEASSLREVSQKLAAESERMMSVRTNRAPGSFSWILSTPWEMETHMSRCQFKNLDVRLGMDIDVVLLGGPVAQDSVAVAAWERHLDGVWAGNVRRMRLMKEDARALFQQLRLLSNNSCAEMANIANNHTREARFKLNDRLASLGVRTAPMLDRVP